MAHATRENLGYLLAKASQRWNELLAEGFAAEGFKEVRPSYGSVLVPLFEEDDLRMGEIARTPTIRARRSAPDRPPKSIASAARTPIWPTMTSSRRTSWRG